MSRAQDNSFSPIENTEKPASIVCNYTIDSDVNTINKYRVYEDFKHFGSIIRINIHNKSQLVFITFKKACEAKNIIGKKVAGYDDVRWPLNNNIRVTKAVENEYEQNHQSNASALKMNNNMKLQGKHQYNPFSTSIKKSNVNTIKQLQIAVTNPTCSIYELKTIITQKLKSIDEHIKIISFKEEINHVNNKIANLIFEFSKTINTDNISSLNLHQSWVVKFINSQNNDTKFFRP